MSIDAIPVTELWVMDTVSEVRRPMQVAGRDFYALSYRHSGEITIKTKDSLLHSGPGCVTFTPKGLSYVTEVCEKTHFTFVHFRLSRDIEATDCAVVFDSDEEMRELFSHLLDAYQRGDDGYLESMSIFYKLLAKLSRSASGDSRTPRVAADARRMLEQSFRSCETSISDVADTLSVSDSYLRRIFKATYSESPIEYLTRIRIENAKRMLESEYHSIADIAALCGFRSVSYFIQSFKEHEGITPSAYRRSHLET